MDVASTTASTGVRVVLAGAGGVVGSLGVVRACAGSGRSVTVPTSARSVGSGFVQTAFIRTSLLLLYTLSLGWVGRRALVGVAIPTSAGGVVLRRVGAITRDAVDDRIAGDVF
jgi:hypothetical protein